MVKTDSKTREWRFEGLIKSMTVVLVIEHAPVGGGWRLEGSKNSSQESDFIGTFALHRLRPPVTSGMSTGDPIDHKACSCLLLLVLNHTAATPQLSRLIGWSRKGTLTASECDNKIYIISYRKLETFALPNPAWSNLLAIDAAIHEACGSSRTHLV